MLSTLVPVYFSSLFMEYILWRVTFDFGLPLWIVVIVTISSRDSWLTLLYAYGLYVWVSSICSRFVDVIELVLTRLSFFALEVISVLWLCS